MDEIITVWVYAFPDGSTLWTEEPPEDRVFTRFRELNPDMPAEAVAGVTTIRMPRSCFAAIPATNLSHELTKHGPFPESYRREFSKAYKEHSGGMF